MNVAMIGLGKLGLPVSCAYASRGHTVYGYEQDSTLRERYQSGSAELYEPHIDDQLAFVLGKKLHITDTMGEAVRDAEIIFIAVPTPSLEDNSFDTSYVERALDELVDCYDPIQQGYKVITIISTVLPGTCRERFVSLLTRRFGHLPSPNTYGFAYNAQFIAMGSTVHDALNPEFVLIGEYDDASGNALERFYHQTVPGRPIQRMTVENAEIVKCTYNNFIGLKIIYANTMMELCAKLPYADCDVVVDTLSLATDRLISPKYLRGGLGDGGGCHPRDNRALSYLAKRLRLSADPFEFVTRARVTQSGWLADVVVSHARRRGVAIKVLGLTFKPNTNLTVDSPALMLIEQLEHDLYTVERYDPVVQPETLATESTPRVYVIGCAWPSLVTYPFVPGSVIVDPHGLLTHAPHGCLLDSVGRDL